MLQVAGIKEATGTKDMGDMVDMEAMGITIKEVMATMEVTVVTVAMAMTTMVMDKVAGEAMIRAMATEDMEVSECIPANYVSWYEDMPQVYQLTVLLSEVEVQILHCIFKVKNKTSVPVLLAHFNILSFAKHQMRVCCCFFLQ